MSHYGSSNRPRRPTHSRDENDINNLTDAFEHMNYGPGYSHPLQNPHNIEIRAPQWIQPDPNVYTRYPRNDSENRYTDLPANVPPSSSYRTEVREPTWTSSHRDESTRQGSYSTSAPHSRSEHRSRPKKSSTHQREWIRVTTKSSSQSKGRSRRSPSPPARHCCKKCQAEEEEEYRKFWEDVPHPTYDGKYYTTEHAGYDRSDNRDRQYTRYEQASSFSSASPRYYETPSSSKPKYDRYEYDYPRSAEPSDRSRQYQRHRRDDNEPLRPYPSHGYHPEFDTDSRGHRHRSKHYKERDETKPQSRPRAGPQPQPQSQPEPSSYGRSDHYYNYYHPQPPYEQPSSSTSHHNYNYHHQNYNYETRVPSWEEQEHTYEDPNQEYYSRYHHYYHHQQSKKPSHQEYSSNAHTSDNNAPGDTDSTAYEAQEEEESNPYTILGVSSDATLDEIKKAYRKLSLKHHPDRAVDVSKEDATKKMQIINEAYTVLSDESLRAKLDASKKKHRKY